MYRQSYTKEGIRRTAVCIPTDCNTLHCKLQLRRVDTYIHLQSDMEKDISSVRIYLHPRKEYHHTYVGHYAISDSFLLNL